MSLAPKFKWNATDAVVQRIAKGYLRRSMTDIQESLSEAASWGAKATLDHKIMGGTPTGSAWHYFANIRRGNNFGARVDSGNMAGSVGYSQTVGNMKNGSFMSTYGLPLNGDPYFFEQENGYSFETWSGQKRDVPGMADPRYGAQQKIDKEIRKALNKRMVSRGFMRGASDTRGARIIDRMNRGYSFSESWGFEYSNNAGSDAYQAYLSSVSQGRLRNEMLGDMRLNTFLQRVEREGGAASAQLYLKRLDGNR